MYRLAYTNKWIYLIVVVVVVVIVVVGLIAAANGGGRSAVGVGLNVIRISWIDILIFLLIFGG